MHISIVVVTFNEEKNIAECLTSLLGLNGSGNDYEIVVIDGDSTDNTQNIVKRFIKDNSGIQLFNNPERSIASNRNMGIIRSHYDFIAFVDADCVVPPDWLDVLKRAYLEHSKKDSRIVAVGGANIPPVNEQNKFQTALGIMLNSFLGSLGSIQGKIYSQPRLVDSLACLNVLYDKKKLVEIGMFDVQMHNQGEDAELNYRLREAGYTLMFVPDSVVYHKMRTSPGSWAKNMFNYGQARIVLLRKHLRIFRLPYLLPLFFLGIFALIPLAFMVGKIFLIPLLYFPGIFIYSVYLTQKRNRLHLVFWVFFCYLITHWAYALGMWKKLLTGQTNM